MWMPPAPPAETKLWPRARWSAPPPPPSRRGAARPGHKFGTRRPGESKARAPVLLSSLLEKTPCFINCPDSKARSRPGTRSVCVCVTNHPEPHSFPLTSAAGFGSEGPGRSCEPKRGRLCKVKSDGFSKPPPTLPPPLPLSLSLFSLCSLDHVQMFPATTALQNSQKERARRAASCRRVDKQTWRGGGGHVRRPGRRGPQGAPRPPLPPRPRAGPWEDTVLGPQGLKDGCSLLTPGSWPHWEPGGAGAGERAAQSFGTRLWAATGLLGVPAPQPRRAATGKPRLHAEPLLPR